MGVRVEANAEPVPGYRLIERLGGGGFGEVWKCEAPGGLHKAIKFVFGSLEIAGDSGQRAEQELKALSRVKTIRHPYILSLERFDIIDGQLLIIMELADRNLWDRYKECRNQGLLGIPRDELISYMLEVAEALDLMNNHYQLQHLDIKPQNLFLVHQHIKVADFGLVKDLEGSQASVTGGITPVYAAPETFDGRVTRFSDQYSLAIVFQELLTGQRPFAGASVRQLIMQHLQAEPNVTSLSENDRPPIQRALSKKPEDRFPTCMEFIHALQQASPRVGASGSAHGISQPQDTTSSPSDSSHWPPPPPSSKRTQVPTITPDEEERTERGRSPIPLHETPSDERNQGTSRTQFIGVPGTENAKGSPPPVAPSPLPPVAPAVPQTPPVQPPEPDLGGALTPVLLVGVGGIGAQVLQAARTVLGERFGSPDAMPQIRTVVIDTDAEVLKLGGLPPECLQPTGEAPRSLYPLLPADLLMTPLNRPSHYLRGQNGRVSVESWINQRMLYRIPREQVTTGVRALGRLALFDHFRVIQRRLQLELETCSDSSLLNQAAKATGLGIRSYRPRVYLVAGLMGGTGSGMFLDLAYLLRNLLRQMGQATPQVTGLLFVPEMGKRGSQHPANRPVAGPSRPSESGLPRASRPSAQGSVADQVNQAARTLTLGNAVAALKELHFYSRIDTEFQARFFEREKPIYDADPPFSPTYLLTLPEGPHKKESREAIGMAARFLTSEIASSLGRWRGTTANPSAQATTIVEPHYRTFGLHRLAFPVREIVQATVDRSLKDTVERWMSKDAVPLQERVREWVQEQWRGHDLGAEHFIARVQEAVAKRMGKDPERTIQNALEPMTERLGGEAKKGMFNRAKGPAPAQPPDADLMLEIMQRLEEVLGRPEVALEAGVFKAADWGISAGVVDPSAKANASEITVKLPGAKETSIGVLVQALRDVSSAIAIEWSQKLAELPVKLIEKPEFRLAGAEEAVRRVVTAIEQVLDRHEPLGQELANKAAHFYGQIMTLIKEAVDSRSWPRRSPNVETLLEWLRAYGKHRYQSLVLQQVLSVYVSLRGCLNDELREINYCRVRLRELQEEFSTDKVGKDAPSALLKQPSALPSATEGRVRFLFPEGWSTVEEAVERVISSFEDEDLLELDARLQKMIRANFVALVHICMSTKNMTKEVTRALREVASAFVVEKLGKCDVSQLFLATHAEEYDAAEVLQTSFEEAVPESASTGPGRKSHPQWERVVLGTPRGEFGERVRELAKRTLTDADLVMADSEDEIVFLREWRDLLLADVDPLGPTGQELYDALRASEHFTPHTRIDVQFTPDNEPQ